MAIFEDMINALGFGGEITPYRYRISVFSSCGAIFEGVKGILSYSETEIIMCIKCGKIKVTGENLHIKKYGENEVAITGKVSGVNII